MAASCVLARFFGDSDSGRWSGLSILFRILSHDPEKAEADLPPDLDKPVRDAFDKMQEELVQLSSRGSRTIAKNSGHYIQLERPDVVIEAVSKIVTQVRSPTPGS